MLDRLTINTADVSRQAARAAKVAAQRISANEPVSADSSARLPHEPLRLESKNAIKGPSEETVAAARHSAKTPGILAPRVADLFLVQHFAQETFPAAHPAVRHEVAVAAYPSMASDNDILLPGQAIPLDWYGNSRLDVTL